MKIDYLYLKNSKATDLIPADKGNCTNKGIKKINQTDYSKNI